MLINVTRAVPPQCISFVNAHEGRRLTAYLDSANIVTVGVGHVARAMRVGDTISDQQADTFLAEDLTTAAERLEAAVGEACVTELTANQYSALVSFVFNVGCDPKWRICQLLKAQKFDQIPAELMRFVNAGGRKVQGLVNRRADEVKLWSTDEPGTVSEDPSSSVTRAVDTPPTVSASGVNPLSKTGHWIAGCAATCVTAASAIAPTIKGGLDQAQDAITPYVGHSTILAGISDHLALAAAGVSALALLLTWMSHQKAKTA